ncbi:MAG: DUF3737 family protein [Acholeplasmatales bacterium]|nr:DUF3737 family protein [Acholeplasmatales bacterium]
MEVVKNQTFDVERALYNIKNTKVENCKFMGPADGESVLKECRNIQVINSEFSLRYPIWHAEGFILDNISMDELTRAPIWYSSDGNIINSKINSIKALRECNNIKIDSSNITSKEFGWFSKNIKISNSKLDSEYLFMKTDDVICDNINMSGKYSFQYMNNLHIKNSYLDTKDAFWHSNNILVEDSVVKGEYLAWFSNNLTLVRCKIIGTQPLCYCKNLKLIDCEMIDTDLSFEYSDVEATIIGNVQSIKNPKSGTITVDSVDEIIMDDQVYECNGKVIIRNK